jgi:hypothetical protein
MLAGAVIALGAGCEVTPRLYLTVRTEVGSPVDAVRVEVFSPVDSGLGAPIDRAIDPARPFEMRVLGRAGGERVRVTVDGLRRGVRRIRQEWVASMPSEGAGYLQVVLWNNCADRECPGGTTCASSGACVSNAVAQPSASPTDAGLGACDDARTVACEGVEAGVFDAATDLGAATMDVLGDATTDGGATLDAAAATDRGADAVADAAPVDAPTDTAADVSNDAPRDAGVDAGRCPGRSATSMPGWTSCAGGGACPTICGDAGTCVHAGRIAVGRDHGCALRSDGRVSCWGSRDDGHLGDGVADGGVVAAPVTVRRAIVESDLTAVVVGGGFDGTCAVDAFGALLCWGSFAADPLNLPFSPAVAATPATRLLRPDAGAPYNTFIGVATHETRTCGIVQGGRVRCSSWVRALPDGSNEVIPDPADYPTTDIATASGALTDVVEVGVGTYHACARRTDGTVWCWGSNRLGQLGAAPPSADAGVALSTVARPVPGTAGAASFGVGDFFSCALVGAEVRCWGNGSYGRLGGYAGTLDCAEGNVCSGTPLVVHGLDVLTSPAGANSPVAQVAVGAEQACARLANGDVWCWGLNDSGQLGVPNRGTGAVESRAGVEGPPVFHDADDVVTGGGGGAGSRSWTCAHRRTDCTWWCWGRVPGEVVAPSEPWLPRPLRWGD